MAATTDIGIDLGTSSILVYAKGKGIVLKEPSVVAYDKDADKVRAIGEEARQMIGRTPGNIMAVRPMRQGVITDFLITERMLRYFIQKAMGRRAFRKPRISICVPSGVTEVERKAVEEATYQAGAREVLIVPEPVAAAIGSGIDITKPCGNMIVDIGGGTTDIAVISLAGTVVSNSVKISSETFDQDIIRYVRKTYNVFIGEQTAEAVKIRIGSAYPRAEEKTMEIKGRNVITGLPATITVSSDEIRGALAQTTNQIADAICAVLEKTPPELASDVSDVEHIIFRNEENGYTVLNLSMKGRELTCVGTLPMIGEGELIEASGDYIEHAAYGKQFRIESYETKVPQDSVALERYLGSGVGAALAARIVRRFGDDTLRIIEEEPERLAEVKGISERKAREIAQQVAEKAEMQNAMIFLSGYGIALNLGAKIYQQYGDNVYRILKENPYKMAEDIAGVGFRTADEIAGKIGIAVDSEFRIKSGLSYVLNQATAEGHVYLPEPVLLRRGQELLGVEPERMQKSLQDMAIDKKAVIRELPAEREGDEPLRIVYASQYYYLELSTARMLHELNITCEEDREAIEKRIGKIEKKYQIELDEMQKTAVVEAAYSGLMILTGGPGTGKTTTINAMIHYFEAEGLDIFLAAPTGRAAKRMTEATGCEACTIHRLLELTGNVDDSSANVHFERNADNPLDADVIIIDEMSMVDIHLIHALLSAIVPGTRLILVGDQNQLPSVGPGSVLRDLIRSECFPIVCLTHIFRQASQSDIVVNAHKIHNGEEVILDNKSKDFFFLKRYDVNVIWKVLVTLVSQKLPRYVDARPQDIQILTPMRKGALGVENLNQILQKYLNPPAPDKAERENGGNILREGDKVMQIRNNYQMEWEIRGINGIVAERGMGVFNGDLGMIRSINPYTEVITVEFEEGKFADYTFKQADELELAYATTIHKAQGSEYPAVVIPLLGGPRMLMTRNLLYTAVTRARKCVTIVGSDVTFQAMIGNHIEANRYTTLARRIREMQEENA